MCERERETIKAVQMIIGERETSASYNWRERRKSDNKVVKCEDKQSSLEQKQILNT